MDSTIEGEDIHDAAIKLTTFCRSFINKLREKNQNLSLRSVLSEKYLLLFGVHPNRNLKFTCNSVSLEPPRFDQPTLTIQKVFRAYLVRVQLERLGIDMKCLKDEWKDSDKQAAEDLVTLHFHKRKVVHRRQLIEKYQCYGQILQIGIQNEVDNMTRLIRRTDKSIDVLNDEGRRVKAESSGGKKTMLVDITENAKKYLTFLQGQESKVRESIKNFISKCKDVEERYSTIQEILDFMDSRYSFVTSDVGMVYYKEWMKEEQCKLLGWAKDCDIAQESLLEAEIQSLESELELMVRCSETFQRMLGFISLRYALEAEQNASQDSIDSGKQTTSIEALKNVNHLEFLQQKLKQIKENNILILSDELRMIYTLEAKKVIPSPSQTNTKTQTNESINKFQDWLVFYYSLPWLEIQELEEAKLKVFQKERRKNLERMRRSLNEREERLHQDKINAERSISRLGQLKRQSKSYDIPTFKREEYLSAYGELWEAQDKFLQTKDDRIKTIIRDQAQLDLEYHSLQQEEALAKNRSVHQHIGTAKFASFERISIDTSMRDLSSRNSFHLQTEEEVALLRLHELSETKTTDKLMNGTGEVIDWRHLDVDITNTAKRKQSRRLSSLLPQMKFNFNRISTINITQRLFHHTDPELEKLIVSVKKKILKHGKGISAIIFTVGEEETSLFSSKNKQNQEEGIPYYQNRIELGTHDSHVLWIQSSSIQQHIITEIKLCDKNQYSGTKSFGYEVVTHHEMACELWLKRDVQNAIVISELHVSYGAKHSMKNSKFISETSLSNYGLADAYLWVNRTSRSELKAKIDPEVIKKEISKYEQMTPDNPSEHLFKKNAIIELKRRLEIQDDELELNLYSEDHERYIIDLFALTNNDLAALKKVFNEIDRDSDDMIGADEVLSFIGESSNIMHDFIEEVSILFIGSKRTRSLSFGQTLRMFMTLASLTKEEILNFVFRIYDKSNRCKITVDDYLRLVKKIDPKLNVSTVIRALETAAIESDRTISLEVFYFLHSRYPSFIFPLFRMQNSIRKKFLGSTWWQKKLKKISQAYRKVNEECLSLSV